MKMFNRLLSVLLVFCMVLAMVPVEVFAVESNPGVLSTNIGSKTFYVGETTEFTFTTTANDDAGKMVLGSFVFSDPSAIEKLEYLESQDGNWYEFSGDFGPVGGFPMIDGTSTFRVTFNKAGSFTLTATMKMADGSGDVCSTQATVTVSDHKPSQLTTDIGSKAFKVGQTTEFTFTTTANDDANTMVLGSFVFSDPSAIEKLEYWGVTENQWIEFYGDFGPAGTGFPMTDATSNFRVTFNKAGTYSVTASMKTAEGGTVLCSTTQSVTVADKVAAALTSDIGSKTFAVGDTAEFTFTTTANDFGGTMVLGSFEFSDPTAIAKLEYLESKDGNWYEFSGDFGPAGGFPLIDGTSTFRVTFNKAGDYTVIASMKKADGGDVLCTTGAIAINVLAKYKVTVSTNIAEAGTISPSNETMVVAGGTTTFTVAANAGYQIDSIGGASSVQIADDKKSATVTVTPESDTTVVVNFVKTYTVTVTHTGEGTVVSNPELAGGSVTVVTGSTVKVTATPNSGYRVSAVEVKSGSEVIKSETFDVHAYEHIETLTMDKDYEVTVTFAQSTYQIAITTPENGTVTIDDADGIVEHGGSTTMTVVADSANGYEIGSVTVNGEPVELNADGKFTISGIKEDKTIVATFVLKQYDVTIGATENGTVTANVSKVVHGNDVIVTITPNAGYSVGTVKVNGVDVTSLNEDSDEMVTFTIPAATTAKHIEVTFVVTEGASAAITELFNYTDAIRVEGMMYVYKNNGTITFTTEKNGIQIYVEGQRNPLGGKNTQSVTISEDTVITKIELRYKAENAMRNRWHEVSGVSSENPLKLVFDKTNANVTLTPAQANANSYYNSDVAVDISVEDPGDYAGIASVKYWVVKDNDSENPTQSETLYTGDTATATWNGSITVDAALNNSDNVKVFVEVTDRAGNTTTESVALKINCTAPVLESVEVVEEIKQPEAVDGYYITKRVIELTIIDRATTFNAEAAKSGVKITATNAAGGAVTVSPSMVSCTSNGTTHVVTITFTMDANYEWSVSYTNLADMAMVSADTTVSHADAYKFTLDSTAPTGTIKYESDVWSELLETLSFGIWSSESMVVTAEQSDATSLLKDIQYYKSNSTKAMTKDELDDAFEAGSFTTQAYTINADEKFAVYARIVDYAGNVTYIGTDGMVYDNTESAITITPDEANENGFYNKDVNVDISVSEVLTEGAAYSGIKTIDYKVVVVNGQTESTTQSGNLFTFNVQNPTYEQLVPSWNGSITVEAAKNNSDYVKVVVTAVDNAGKVSVKEVPLSINIDELSATIEVTGEANKIVGDRGYFGVENRKATITILNDRGSSFDKEAATAGITITALDAAGNVVENAYTISDWTSNGTTHTAEITFLADANYSWSFSYTNEADNALDVESKLSTGDSVTPFIFTIDDTDPAGTATINTDVWDELLDVLTFGLFSNTSFTVVADAEDQTSPIVIQYYKTDRVTAMTAAELDAVEFLDYSEAYVENHEQQKSLTIEDEERFVVYLKVTDYAGNYIYLNADGAIVDKTSAEIVLTPEAPNANGFYGMSYGETVDVAVKVTDVEPYSGIKTVDYWIVKDGNEQEPTQSGNLFTFSNASPIHSDLVYEWNGNIAVSTELNNSCNVVVHVKVVDNAGNEYETTQALDIDITAPAISVSYDDNDARNDKYFDGNRTATIVITERTHHFDATAATAGITITAVDAKGNVVEIDPATMISGWETKEGATADAATHTATISYTVDANYTFSIGYTDKADNANTAVNTGTSVAPYEFAVDKVAPVGTVTGTSEEGRTTTWDKLVTDLTFGFWSGKKITITGTSDDVTSPIESVQYYKVSNSEALTEEELAKVTTWSAFESLVAVPNEQFTVYLKITDNAGNVTYISTDGMILDDTAPREEAIAPEITTTPEQPVNGLYNRDVKVSIEVVDPTVGDTFAGLKTITYRVLNMGVETQSGTLYSFDTENPAKGDLLQTWTGEIVVNSELNNSNDVVIEIFAEDNAGNTSKDSVAIKIDITAPQIDVTYTNNTPDSTNYYNADRTATITITERNLDTADIKITITKDGKEFTDYIISNWETKTGTGNLDDTTHTATITYNEDGDYTFAIECKDQAEWGNEEVNYGNSATPTEFTIDKTNPVIRVSYNNNDAANGNYFDATRTATITITEHNFVENRVVFTRNAARGGTNPNIAWTHNGDTHIATISYTADGDYTFDVTMTDMAGNNSGAADFTNSVAGKDFVIDTTFEEMITIGGVESGKAYGYSDDVIPTLDISDINLEKYTVTLVGVQKDTTIDLTKEVNELLNAGTENVTGTFDIFEVVQDMDGIYTLTVTSQDKAGNQDAEEITFTVNRFGSVYVYDQYLVDLISDGGAYVLSVTDDLIIVEYNADKLVSDSLVIEITCDGKPLENVIYEVTPEINDSVAVGESGWYQYKYTISKDNFASDGVYKISVSTKDATGNTPENNRYEDLGITFRVDSTLAEISSIVGLEEAIINATEQVVKYTVYDTMGIKSIKIYVDGELVDEVTDFSADLNNYSGSFTLTEQSAAQSIRIVVEDMSGNITDTDAETFSSAYEFNKSVTVSTNIFVRWYANKPLFWGSIGGVTVVAAGLWFFLVAKRKKKEEANA